jgi:hypothetical protein
MLSLRIATKNSPEKTTVPEKLSYRALFLASKTNPEKGVARPTEN